MKVFANKRFTERRRDFECTQLVAAEILDEVGVAPAWYEPVDASILAKLTPLWIEGGVRYWGYL
jgi:hypothetical protein